MKKILMILICLNFGFGFNTKDANESIDNLAYKSKIMGELINNFLIQNQPKVEAFKNEMIKSFFLIGFSSFKIFTKNLSPSFIIAFFCK